MIEVIERKVEGYGCGLFSQVGFCCQLDFIVDNFILKVFSKLVVWRVEKLTYAVFSQPHNVLECLGGFPSEISPVRVTCWGECLKQTPSFKFHE